MIFTLDFWPAYLIGLGFLAVYMVGMWLFSLYIKDTSMIDSVWGIGVIIVGWLYFLLVSDVTTSARGWLVMGLVTAWGLRLSWTFFARNLTESDGENMQYAALREQFGKRWWWLSLLRVFLPYVPLIWIISVPMLVVHLYRSGPTTVWLDWLGAAVWGVGFILAVLSDWNPDRFRWHPDIIGDALQWWGIFLIAATTPNGWLTVVSPLVMTLWRGSAFFSGYRRTGSR